MPRVKARFLIVFCLVFGMAVLPLLANEKKDPPKRTKKKVTFKITGAAWGPTQMDVDAAKARVEASTSLRSLVGGAKYRVIGFEFIEREEKPGPTLPPTQFRVVYYDYTNDRTLVAVGDFSAKDPITVREESFQPVASPEEFEEAVGILRGDPAFAALAKSGRLKVFRPMPDITVLQGTVQRLVNVGLEANGDGIANEIVGVGLRDGKVVRYPDGAPSSAISAPDACGTANSGQGSTGRGIAGQSTLTVTDGTNTLWEMLIIRPSASSGTRASGVEIRDVKYKGKSVLKRGHVPILNVQYVPQTCGPYRDWQYAEDFFNAPATGAQNPAAGIRILAAGQVATTVLETGNDNGTFQGVAVYSDHGEVILVSELNADWYRYIMEWRFAADGTIRPRFGFGATKNNCVCNVHHHHAFWRFDFDIVQPNNKVFRLEQRSRKFRTLLTTETKQLKNVALNRGLVIQNSTGNEAYALMPNIFDGVAGTFGVSDMWVLRYKSVVGGTPLQNELDDGFNQTTSQNAWTHLDDFLTGESIADQDVVVWYGAHFVHADGGNIIDPNRSPEHITGDHVVGPDIRPIQW